MVTFGRISNHEARRIIFGNDTPATGYVKFESRNWSYKGDSGSWARHNEDGTITVKRAARGTLSSAYYAELCEFCEKHGQDFNSIGHGTTITFEGA